jgi:TM2 domain-containing membrane protein YozV
MLIAGMDYVICDCEHCGGHLEFDQCFIGSEVDCPHCDCKTRLARPVPQASVAGQSAQSSQSDASLPTVTSAPSRLTLCPDCGNSVSKRAAACPQCGAPLGDQAPPPIHQAVASLGYAQPVYVQVVKSRSVYVILGIFLGFLGIHNFYAGYNGKGAAQLAITLLIGWWLLIPLAIIAVWNIVEVITIKCDAQGVAMR